MLISRRFCFRFSILGVPALALGCVAPVDHDTEAVDSTRENLFRATVDMRTGGEVRVWTENNNVVPVCWIQSGWESREKTIIQDAVESTWATQTSLQFTWNGICPTSGSQKFVRINITTVSPGNESGRVPPTIGLTTLRAPNQSPSMELSFRSPSSPLSPGDVTWIQYLGVHEFGHILGFDHEMNRWDNPETSACAPEMGLQNPNGIGQGYYDHDSVMNYCGPNNGTLTTWDRLGAQQIYARPGSR